MLNLCRQPSTLISLVDVANGKRQLIHALSDSDITWQVGFHKGKDQLARLGPKECNEKGNTCRTLFWLMKRVHRAGKVFVLDSTFCVLKVIVELKKCGVFVHAVVKKIRYWSKYAPGEKIESRLDHLISEMNGQ